MILSLPYLENTTDNIIFKKASHKEKIKLNRKKSYMNKESNIQSEVQNGELSGSVWRFIKNISLRVFLVQGKVAKEAPSSKQLSKSKALQNIREKVKICGVNSIGVFYTLQEITQRV